MILWRSSVRLQMLFYFFFTAVFPILVNDVSNGSCQAKNFAAILDSSFTPNFKYITKANQFYFQRAFEPNLLSPSLLCPCPSIPAFSYSTLFSAQQPSWACSNGSLSCQLRKTVPWLCISLSTKAWAPSIWHDRILCCSLTLHHSTYPTPAMLISRLLFLHNRHPRTEGPLLVLCLEGSSPRELHGHFPPLLQIFAEMSPSYWGLPDTTLYFSLASFTTLFFSIYRISHKLTWYIF